MVLLLRDSMLSLVGGGAIDFDVNYVAVGFLPANSTAWLNLQNLWFLMIV